jgi:hypothetical protein
VRVKDTYGQYSQHTDCPIFCGAQFGDAKDIAWVNVALDTVDEDPEVTMEWWSPCYEILTLCAPGSPDARPSTLITFTATGTDDVGIVAYQWDVNGDCGVGVPDTDPCIDLTTVGNTTTYTYGTTFVGQPRVRVKDTYGQYSQHTDCPIFCGPEYGDRKDIAFVGVDLDVVITPPDAEGRFYPFALFGNDGEVDTLFEFDASESTDGDPQLGGAIVQYRWDFNGDGNIDRITAGPTTTYSYDTPEPGFPSGFGAGSYAATVTVVDNDGATDTDQFDDLPTGLFPVNVDVGPGCGGVDADGDGVPCDFEIFGDGDTTYFKKSVNYVRKDPGNPAPITLTTWSFLSPDLAVMTPLNLRKMSFFGTTIVNGPYVFANPDVLNPSLKDTMINILTQSVIGASSDSAYVAGTGFCLKIKPSSPLGYAFGFCKYRSVFDDDQGFLELEDEYKIKANFGGNRIQYEGFTVPLVSAEIQVDVQP